MKTIIAHYKINREHALMYGFTVNNVFVGPGTLRFKALQLLYRRYYTKPLIKSIHDQAKIFETNCNTQYKVNVVKLRSLLNLYKQYTFKVDTNETQNRDSFDYTPIDSLAHNETKVRSHNAEIFEQCERRDDPAFNPHRTRS